MSATQPTATPPTATPQTAVQAQKGSTVTEHTPFGAAADGASTTASYAVLEAALGLGLERGLMEQALTHRSYAYENGGLPNNERLEFLGDSVLGLVVTDALYATHPDLPEGQLAKLRASVVNTRALADVARGIGLGRWVRLGKGEVVTNGEDKSSILADTTEALLGAIFLERGLPGATAVIHRLFDPVMLAAAAEGAALDWKTSLQELAAAGAMGPPEYLITESGPDHLKAFRAVAMVTGQPCGQGAGTSKKQAEQHAAEAAWRTLSARAELAGPAGLPELPELPTPSETGA